MPSVLAKHAAPASIFSWAFLALGLVLFGLAGLAWSNHLSDSGVVVAGNVRYAGAPVEGLDRGELTAAVAGRAEELLANELTIEYGKGEFTVPFADIGFSYDQEATADAIIAARHQGSVWDQFSSWAIGGLIANDIEEVWDFDPKQAMAALDDHPGLTPLFVTEPQVTPDGAGLLTMTPGVVGTEADIDDIVGQLGRIDLTDPPQRLTTDVEEIHPTVTDSAAEEATDRLNELTGNGVEISVEGRGAALTGPALQDLLEIEVADGTVEVGFDTASLQSALERTIVGPVGDFVEPVLEVNGDDIDVITPGEAPPVCCRRGTGAWLGGEILGGATGPFGLPTRPTDDPTFLAWADGSTIVEKVGEFTTPHACCEPRVENIHRIADIVRGAYLVPGETMSLNEFVGPRTVENGFVSAGAIRQGHMIQETGGGVSQFATTIFNAAYFAGLDIVEYRSHSIYFSRYPYGREATISSPGPDLVFTNSTDYPILIWTSYTDTSITVTMYSTRNVGVDELDQRTSRRGVCTQVETDRERTFSDGRVVVDTFFAEYRPAEGIDCSGNRIPAPTGG
jgi:hypothetical protein